MKTIDFTGIIGIEISPQAITDFLKNAENDDITINLVSPGGYLYEGFQIYNLIKEYPGRKTVIVNGMVASAAAYISTAFDTVKVKDNSTFMIHNAQGGAIGDYRVLEKEAKELKRLNEVMGKAYSKKSGRDQSEIIGLMNEETWFYGAEIIEAGLAEELVPTNMTLDRENTVKAARLQFASFKPAARKDDILKAAAMIKEDKPGVAGDNKNNGGKTLNEKKTEVLNTIKVLKANADITLAEVAEAMGLRNMIVTDEHEKAVKTVNSLAKTLGGTDIVERVEAMLTENKAGREAVRNAKLDTMYGASVDAKGVKNELRFYMGKETAGAYGADLDAKIENIKKEDPLAKRLMAERADNTSPVNQIGATEHLDASTAAETGGRRIDKI